MELKQLFEDLLNIKPIFLNREVLRPSYTPDYLPHRIEQINRMATTLVVAIRGETPSNILIYGKSGTGKTAVVKYVGRELEIISESKGKPCTVLYMNCEVVDTQYRVLYHLAGHFDKEVPPTGWPTDQVYAEFKNGIDNGNRAVIIILDEVDKLVKKGDEILYNLSRINSELSHAKVSIIGISNDLKFIEFLDPRVRSSLGEEEIIFPPYNADQLRDILEQRASMAFKPDALSPEVIPLCAAFAAQEHGDARRALDLLRVSAELAERAQNNIVMEEHVRWAQDKIELDRIVEVVRTLPTQSKLVLYSMVLLNRKSLTTGEVYNVYKDLCHKTDMAVLTQRRVTDLISELDMLGIVSATVVSKGRYGRTKEISVSIPIDQIKYVLLEDYRLKSLGGVRLKSISIPDTQTRLYGG
ncbi:MAG: ORC1-type DNA replication protein [Methanocellales archaeon]|nr:ORC1-type DNA replication protein [Methanocellales archaeon]MDD4897937.1 ORC1-type DNA replication protein [Methanocellales archaeon]MDD5446357.1 ORC1-type DNA replication protein [Methanocellales archaeon]